MGEALVKSQAQSDEDLTVRDIGIVYKKGGHKLSYKTRSACHKEIFTGNAKWELEVYRELRPYITTGLL